MTSAWNEITDKPVVTLFTAHDVMNYFDNCIRDDMFDIMSEKLDDETWNKLLMHVGKSLDDKRLEKMVLACFDTWIGEKFNDMVYEVLDEYLEDVVTSSGIVSEEE